MRIRSLTAIAAAGVLIASGAGIAQAVTVQPDQAGSLALWGTPDGAGVELVGAPALDGPVTGLYGDYGVMGAVTASGSARVWGGGAGTPIIMGMPGDLTDVKSLAFTSGSGGALHKDGSITTWGGGPVASVAPEAKGTAFAITAFNVYAVQENGSLVVEGMEVIETPAELLAAPATPGDAVVDVKAGSMHVVALRANGTIVAWAADDPSLTPLATVPDFGGKKVVAIDTGSNVSGALLEDGTVRVWGQPDSPLATAPVPDFGGKKVTDFDLFTSGVARTEDGKVHVWGEQDSMETVPSSLTGRTIAGVATGSNAVGVIVPTFHAAADPVVTGTARVGETLKAVAPRFSGTPDSVSGQWFANGAALAGATSPTLALTAAHVGTALTYSSVIVKGNQTFTGLSEATAPVAKATAAVRATAVTGPLQTPKPKPVKKGLKGKAKKAAVKKAKAKAAKKATRSITVSVGVQASPGASPQGSAVVEVAGRTSATGTVAVNAQGQATYTLPTALKGTYRVTVTYAGSAGVAGGTDTLTVSVS